MENKQFDKQLEKNKCRICLHENVIVNWDCYLKIHNHITYKDCYYKYTQLDCIDENNLYLSTMLCTNCSDGLEAIHTLITTAVETHYYLQEHLVGQMQCKKENQHLETNFETVLISETDIKPEIQSVPLIETIRKDYFNEESEDKDLSIHPYSMVVGSSREGLCEESNSCSIAKDNVKECLNEETDISKTSEGKEINQSRKSKSKKEICKKNNSTKSSSDDLQSDTRTSKKKRHWPPTCCSICSKVLASKYAAIQHEQIHVQNRERNEICTECGMQFYNKSSLRTHEKTHIKNREKTHKCEFCEKAFYSTGTLNIHRRIHMGQMIKCTFCTKEYYRQVDLDKHMLSHAATRISSDTKAKKKYFVCCDICKVTIRSTQYKEHAARHLNDPLAKCAICDKEFFSRNSCLNHLKTFHQKGTGERSNFVISIKKSYYSNLFMQQNVGKLFTKE